MDTLKITYTRRYVAYADILGFSSLVQKSTTDSGIFEILVQATSRLSQEEPFSQDKTLDNTVKRTLQGNFGETWRSLYDSFSRGWGLTFSDNLFLSQPDNLQGLYILLLSLSMLARDLLSKGILIRGGVSIGEIYHSDRTVFGPALIDAITLENKIAVYPRILLSDKITQSIKQSCLGDNSTDSKFGNGCYVLMKRDFDGFYHLDYLSDKTFLDKTIQKPGGLSLDKLRNIVQSHLTRTKDCTKRVKWQWTLRYIEETMARARTKRTCGRPGYP